MRHSRPALILLLAFVASLFAPVQAGWACPDGTPCVAERQHGFRCAGGQCRAHASCCLAEHPAYCKHGAPAAVNRPGTGPVLEAPDHCRFLVLTPLHPPAAGGGTAALFSPTFVALPQFAAPELCFPAAAPCWQFEYTLGYRPPPYFPAVPSRGPPPA